MRAKDKIKEAVSNGAKIIALPVSFALIWERFYMRWNFFFLVAWQINNNFLRNNAMLSAKFKQLTLQHDPPPPQSSTVSPSPPLPTHIDPRTTLPKPIGNFFLVVKNCDNLFINEIIFDFSSNQIIFTLLGMFQLTLWHSIFCWVCREYPRGVDKHAVVGCKRDWMLYHWRIHSREEQRWKVV